MIGASLAPVLLASFFWKRVTPAGGVTSILAGMIVPVINKIMEVSEVTFSIFGISFPLHTDYIAIPSLVMSLLMLIVVSLLTPPSGEEKWKPFFS